MLHSTAVDVTSKNLSNTRSHLSCGFLRATARAVTPDLLLWRRHRTGSAGRAFWLGRVLGAACAGGAVTTTVDAGSVG